MVVGSGPKELMCRFSYGKCLINWGSKYGHKKLSLLALLGNNRGGPGLNSIFMWHF